MHDPVRKWHEEHMYFHRLLELLRHEVDQLALGETPVRRDMLAAALEIELASAEFRRLTETW